MTKRMIYLNDLPPCNESHDVRCVERTLKGLLTFFQDSSEVKAVLPSISQMASQMQTSREWVKAGLDQIRTQGDWQVDAQSGYFGAVILTRDNAKADG